MFEKGELVLGIDHTTLGGDPSPDKADLGLLCNRRSLNQKKRVRISSDAVLALGLRIRPFRRLIIRTLTCSPRFSTISKHAPRRKPIGIIHKNEDLVLIDRFGSLERHGNKNGGAPGGERKHPLPFDRLSSQSLDFFPDAELATESGPQIAVEVVGPVSAVDPPTAAFFAAAHLERARHAGIAERHHGLGEAGSPDARFSQWLEGENSQCEPAAGRKGKGPAKEGIDRD